MNTNIAKITPAQRERLRQVEKGAIERHGESRSYGFYRNTSGFGGKGTYVMWCNLEDAGLITWTQTGVDTTTKRPLFKAVLTDAGRAALQQGVKQ